MNTTDKTRVAFCVAGQPRFFDQGYEMFKKRIFDINPDAIIDTFLHCWFDKADAGKEYDCASWVVGKSGKIAADTSEKLIELYNPKSHIIEPQKSFELPRFYHYSGDQPQHVPYSMFYSVKESIKLKEKYEKEHNFTYDWVFRARYDFCLDTDISLSKYDNKIMYVPNNIQVNNGVNNQFNDMFAFSSSSNMDKYGTMFDCLDKYYTDDGIKYVQEALLGHHFKKNRILVSPLPLKAGMFRESHIHWIINCDENGHLR